MDPVALGNGGLYATSRDQWHAVDAHQTPRPTLTEAPMRAPPAAKCDINYCTTPNIRVT